MSKCAAIHENNQKVAERKATSEENADILVGVPLEKIYSDAAAHIGCDGMCCVECVEAGIAEEDCPNLDFLILTRQLKALEKQCNPLSPKPLAFNFPRDWFIRKAREEEGNPNNMGFVDWDKALSNSDYSVETSARRKEDGTLEVLGVRVMDEKTSPALLPCSLCGSPAEQTLAGVGCTKMNCHNQWADIPPERWNTLNSVEQEG